uniref:Uncharacterized protein n=1 Tax=Pyramimonas orientalis virus TaxID=455367 RepID=A0A7M3UPC7_POV01|nr:hypothetical protein HWQ62_00477 [Pyramimonas orientalis virus]
MRYNEDTMRYHNDTMRYHRDTMRYHRDTMRYHRDTMRYHRDTMNKNLYKKLKKNNVVFIILSQASKPITITITITIKQFKTSKKMSFSMEDVKTYIQRVQKESYCLTAAYWRENQNEEWYIKSMWCGVSYNIYSHPCIPYIELMECRDEEEDKVELLAFIKQVFQSHKLDEEQNNYELMMSVAQEKFDKL